MADSKVSDLPVNSPASVAAFRTILAITNVTNDAQTKAAVVPNTLPTAGQIPVGNAGGTAYAGVSMTGDATLASTGVISIGAGKITEAMQVLADNVTNNAGTSAHGYLKKLSNVASEFMNGQGNWATPAGGSPGGSTTEVQYNNAGAFGGMAGVTWASNQLLITAQAAGTTPFSVKGATSQTADLTSWVTSTGAAVAAISMSQRLYFGTAYIGVTAGDSAFISLAPGGSPALTAVTNRVQIQKPLLFEGPIAAYPRCAGLAARDTIPSLSTNAAGGGTDTAFISEDGLNNDGATYRIGSGFTFVAGAGGAPVTGNLDGGPAGNLNLVLSDGGAPTGTGAAGANGRVIVKNRAGTELFTMTSKGVAFMANVAAAPATPTGGGVIYVESGALKYKGSSGTVTTLGAA